MTLRFAIIKSLKNFNLIKTYEHFCSGFREFLGTVFQDILYGVSSLQNVTQIL